MLGRERRQVEIVLRIGRAVTQQMPALAQHRAEARLVLRMPDVEIGQGQATSPLRASRRQSSPRREGRQCFRGTGLAPRRSGTSEGAEARYAAFRRARSCGAVASMAGPLGTLPPGFTVLWLL